jgi:hypothetical protein
MAALDVLLGHSADHHLSQSDRLNKVTAEEIHEIAKELFRRKQSHHYHLSPRIKKF